ncbi:hypothetical protein MMC13_000179 [Lambiella insularis]|nr:hypothetical protein [Lambiella insularis]
MRAASSNALLELKELVFFCRYGDNVRDRLALLRYRSKAENIPGHERISGKHWWTTIATELQDEKDRYEEALQTGEKTDRPLTIAVWTACSELGFDKHSMIDAINMYGTRNNAVHADVKEMIKLCRWFSLAKTLYQDLNDLPLLIPPSRPQDLKMVGSIIEDLRDTYFEPDSGDANDPDTWIQSAKARELSQKRKLEKEEEEEIALQRAAAEAIHLRNRQAKVNKAARKQASAEAMVERAKEHQQFARELEISSPAEYQEVQRQITETQEQKAGKKRVASTEEPRGSEKCERAKQMKQSMMMANLAMEFELSRQKFGDLRTKNR